MIRQYNKLDEDESSWIYELKNVNERLLYISRNFDKKFDDYPESFFRARAAVCDCICQILDHVKYKEKPNGLLETMIEAERKKGVEDGKGERNCRGHC